jgi:5-methylthioadenosine/S-adenosylhomocysteine deaminase
LVYSAHGSDVEHSIIDGKVVMKHRQVLTMDVEKTMAEVQKRAEEIKLRLV